MRYEVLVGNPGDELNGYTFVVDAGDGDELTAAFRAGVISHGASADDGEVLATRSEQEWAYR